MRSVVVALALLAVSVPAAAQTVDIVDYGTYTTAGDEPSPNSPPDAVVELRNVHEPRFTERTTTIPGQLCQRFGISFVLREPVRAKRPASGALAVTVRIDHPRLVNPDGRSSEGESWSQTVLTGVSSMAGFDFDQAWEIAPGDWTIAVMLDDETLASKTFHVTDVPGWASGGTSDGAGTGDGCQHLS